MPNTDPQQTLDTRASAFHLQRLESAWLAWRTGDAAPCWQQYLPADDEPCSSELIFNLMQVDIECRIKAGLPAVLVERYFEHPRLHHDNAQLNDAWQVQLIQWEYLQRFQHGERPRRSDYESAFPRHREELQQMKPRSRCPRCEKIQVLEETFQTLSCPDCGCESSLLSTAPHYIAPTPPPNAAPTELDPRTYELMGALGKGGMGEVYRCSDPSLGRELAIKVIKANYRGHPHVEYRFLREARITGSLQHPGIVPVHNLGRLRDGRLHYTMRLIRGQTFAEILKEEAGKPERLPYLLSIFEKICQAVAYAHSKHVIHRDLKPHNVMVGKFGEVQVMDWGLAKVLTPGERGCVSAPSEEEQGTRIHTEEGQTPLELTRMGGEMGTPAYMPPEQALGEWDTVDERADVFALGAILCEMLTGQPAYVGRDGEEVYLRAKRGDLAETLSRLRECWADAALTALCRDCLNSYRGDRPRDADVVAKRVAANQAEVQGRLRQAEVERAEAQLKAREERKRRRLLIALVGALLAGAALTTWLAVRATAAAEAERQAKEAEAEQRHKAEESKARADEEARHASAVNEFLQKQLLGQADIANQPRSARERNPDVTVRELLDRAARDIEDKFADFPLTEASIRMTIGDSYLGLGRYAEAQQHLERAIQLRTAQLGPDHSLTLESCNSLAGAYLDNGRIPEAVRLYEQLLRQREAKLGPDHSDTLTSRNNLATAYHYAGRFPEAIRLHEQNLPLREAKLGREHLDTVETRGSLANAYLSAARSAEAIRLHEQNLPLLEAQLGPDHPLTFGGRNNLATAYMSAGRTSEAIPLLEQNLKQLQAKRGPDHPETLNSRNNLANAYLAVGRTADAIRLHQQTLQQREAKLGPDHPNTLNSRGNLASAYLAAGRTAEAIGLLEPTLQQMKAKLGNDHPRTFACCNTLGEAYRRAGRLTETIGLLEQNLPLREAKLGPNHPQTLRSLANLGAAYRDAGRLKDAIPRFEQALQRGRKRSGGLPRQLANLPGDLAQAYEQDGQFAQAEAIYRELLEQARRQFGAEDPRTAGQIATLGFNLLRQHKHTEAEPLLRDCLKVRAAKQPDEWATFNTRSLLGAVLLGQKKYAEAEPLLVQGYEGMQQRQDKIPPAYRQRRLTEALQRLVQLYEAIGKKDEAAKWRKQLEERKAEQTKPKS